MEDLGSRDLEIYRTPLFGSGKVANDLDLLSEDFR